MQVKGISYDFSDLITKCEQAEDRAYKILNLTGNSPQQALKNYINLHGNLRLSGSNANALATNLKHRLAPHGNNVQLISTEIQQFATTIYNTVRTNTPWAKQGIQNTRIPTSLITPYSALKYAEQYVQALSTGNTTYINGVLTEIIGAIAIGSWQDSINFMIHNTQFLNHLVRQAAQQKATNWYSTANIQAHLNYISDYATYNNSKNINIKTESKSNFYNFHITEFDISKSHKAQLLAKLDQEVTKEIEKRFEVDKDIDILTVTVHIDGYLLDSIAGAMLDNKYSMVDGQNVYVFFSLGGMLLGSEFFTLLEKNQNNLYMDFGNDTISVDKDDISEDQKVTRSSVGEDAQSLLEEERLKKIVSRQIERKLGKTALWYGKPLYK